MKIGATPTDITDRRTHQIHTKDELLFVFLRNLCLFKYVEKNIDILMLFLLISPFLFYIMGLDIF